MVIIVSLPPIVDFAAGAYHGPSRTYFSPSGGMLDRQLIACLFWQVSYDAKARHAQLAAGLANPPPAPRQIAAE
jgi:hypothetical protein